MSKHLRFGRHHSARLRCPELLGQFSFAPTGSAPAPPPVGAQLAGDADDAVCQADRFASKLRSYRLGTRPTPVGAQLAGDADDAVCQADRFASKLRSYGIGTAAC